MRAKARADFAATAADRPSGSLLAQLIPITLIVWLGYSAIGIPLATLPLQVHQALGYSTTTVGVVIGLSAVATFVTRPVGGDLAERNGPKSIVLFGLAGVSLAGLAYLVSLEFPQRLALAVLVFGRLLLGLGESLLTTSAVAWAVTRVGVQHTGKAMAWIGIAMFGALATGAPLGVALGSAGGFQAASLAASIAPLLAIPIVLALSSVGRASARKKSSPAHVLRAVWLPGLAMVLGSSGYGTVVAFLALLYAASSWIGAGIALSGFSVAYIAARLMFSGLPDRFRGTWVAAGSLVVHAGGLILIALAPNASTALAGAVVAGFGYSLVFPALGVEVVRRAPTEIRSSAISAFLGCFDLGVGAAGPVIGVVADAFGLSAAFIAAAAAASLSVMLISSASLISHSQAKVSG